MENVSKLEKKKAMTMKVRPMHQKKVWLVYAQGEEDDEV